MKVRIQKRAASRKSPASVFCLSFLEHSHHLHEQKYRAAWCQTSYSIVHPLHYNNTVVIHSNINMLNIINLCRGGRLFELGTVDKVCTLCSSVGNLRDHATFQLLPGHIVPFLGLHGKILIVSALDIFSTTRRIRLCKGVGERHTGESRGIHGRDTFTPFAIPLFSEVSQFDIVFGHNASRNGHGLYPLGLQHWVQNIGALSNLFLHFFYIIRAFRKAIS